MRVTLIISSTVCHIVPQCGVLNVTAVRRKRVCERCESECIVTFTVMWGHNVSESCVSHGHDGCITPFFTDL